MIVYMYIVAESPSTNGGMKRIVAESKGETRAMGYKLLTLKSATVSSSLTVH